MADNEEVIEITAPEIIRGVTHLVFNGQKLSTDRCTEIVFRVEPNKLPTVTMKYHGGRMKKVRGRGAQIPTASTL